MWPVIIRVVAAAVRIVLATVIIGALGYVGLDWVAKNWMPDVDEESAQKVQVEKDRRGL